MSDAKLIARGWERYRQMVVPRDASEVQVKETRQAFYAGASVLFTTLVNALEPGQEATDADLRKMNDIQAEIDAFGQELDRRAFGAKEH